MAYEYDYPRPALTVDCAVFAPVDGRLQILLVRRDNPPFEGHWATPGGFVEIDEPIEQAARRELAEETGLDLEHFDLQRFDVFGRPGRDPRGRVISVAHWALVGRDSNRATAASDAREVGWFDLEDLPELAFDHDELIPAALQALRNQGRTGGIGRGVLEEPFTAEALRDFYETILNRSLHAGRFIAALRDAGLLVEEPEPPEADRADQVDRERLFRFEPDRYDALRHEPISKLTP